MKTARLLILIAVCCATGTWSMAQAAEAPAQAPAKPATPAPASESAAPKGDEPSSSTQSSATQEATQQGARAEESAADAKPKASEKSGKGGSPERFVPSEQVRADFDVSFPIDI